MNVLDLFSGIGGFSLGLERAGMRTVAFCEIEPFCRAVLAKHWPNRARARLLPFYRAWHTANPQTVYPSDVQQTTEGK
jgi:site-specific DNA-cytosine methylase